MKIKQVLGRFIVADPEICHGKPTFTGTRILVEDILNMVSKGYGWDYIMEQWPGKLSKAAISEAVSISKDSFIKQVGKAA